MKGCSVCGSSEEHFDGANCVDHLLARLAEAEKRVRKIEGSGRYWLEHEEEVRAKMSDYAALESRLRDAEARVVILPSEKEFEQVASDECQQDWTRLEYKEVYKDGFLSGAKWLREEVLATPTTGAYNRLRNEVLEEAAKIVERGSSKTPEPLSRQSIRFRLAETIRAAKKVEQ